MSTPLKENTSSIRVTGRPAYR